MGLSSQQIARNAVDPKNLRSHKLHGNVCEAKRAARSGILLRAASQNANVRADLKSMTALPSSQAPQAPPGVLTQRSQSIKYSPFSCGDSNTSNCRERTAARPPRSFAAPRCKHVGG